VAGHLLIDRHLRELGRRLPASALDELSDGLTETYEHRLRDGLVPDRAAAAAVSEFGTVEEITAAFTLLAPGRRTARVLLTTGPVVGGAWAACLIALRAWTWPVSVFLALCFGALLLITVVMLASVVTSKSNYRRTRLTAVSGTATILLDASLLLVIATVPPDLVWPAAIAIPASLARITYTSLALPRILAS
jgi:hypothetical protein